MEIYFTWDDGAKEDLKLFELHKKYNLPGMFFVPSFNIEGRDVLSKDEIEENCSDLISFGGHTRDHVYLTTIPERDIDAMIEENQKYLEENTNAKIRHFCLPGGKYNRRILKHVFKYFDTCRTADTMSFKKNVKLFKPTIHIYPRGKKSVVCNAIRNGEFSTAFHILFMRNDYLTIIEYVLWKYKNKDCQIIFWGHSWEIDELKWWDLLEDIFILVSEKYRSCVHRYEDIDL